MATYSTTELVTFTAYTQNFIYGLIQQMAASPYIANNTNFFGNLSKIQTFLDNAVQAGIYSDQYNAQLNLDAAYEMISNQQYYFT